MFLKSINRAYSAVSKRRLCDRTLSEIGYGGMGLSVEGRPPENQAYKTIHAALDSGVNYVDTADVYCLDERDIGHNERLVTDAVRSWRNGDPASILIGTKGGLERVGKEWRVNGKPSHLRKACENNLKALQVDSIEFYQLHAVDPKVPLCESINELRKLQREGLIKHIGLSNVSLDQLIEAREMVDIVAVQNRCNILDASSITSGLLEYCEKAKIIFFAYSPVGGFRRHSDFVKEKEIEEMATKYKCSPYQLALAYLINLSPIIIPIPGSRSPARAKANSEAVNIKLEVSDLKKLFSLSK